MGTAEPRYRLCTVAAYICEMPKSLEQRRKKFILERADRGCAAEAFVFWGRGHFGMV